MIQEPHQPARLVVHWLNLLADLQVRHGAGYETVRQTLQRIVDLDPHLAAAEIARHRLALLNLELKAREKSQAIKLGSYEQNIGLKQDVARPRSTCRLTPRALSPPLSASSSRQPHRAVPANAPRLHPLI